MKNKINKLLLLYFGIQCFSLSSCTGQFEKWNTNPNEATQDMMLVDNLFTGSFFVQLQKNVMPIAQEGVCGDEAYQISINLLGDSYAGYMGTLLTKVGTPAYKMLADWCDVPFERAFVGIMPSWKSIKDKVGNTDPIAYSMATIVKVAGLHRTTDIYGPIPYTNFGNGASYDSQKDVYYAFFDELDDAINVLTEYCEKYPNGSYMADYDNVFDGNVKKWVKFANSLRLRLAIRISYVEPDKAKSEAEKATSHPFGLIADKTETAALQHKKITFNHPLYIIYHQFDDVRMGAVMDSYLNGFKDPRLNVYFTTLPDGTYKGVRSGIEINNKDEYAKGPFSGINVESTTPVVWMNPSESYFLRAEGALRGWNMGGTAKDFYEKGIKSSFDYNGITSSKADDYLNGQTSPSEYVDPKSSNNNMPAANISNVVVKWSDSDSFERKLEKIITQKWIAIFPDGQEAWSEFRRTGYPKVFPVVINSEGVINTATQIRRVPFSSKERLSNLKEVEKAEVLLNGPDNGNTKLWWDKK